MKFDRVDKAQLTCSFGSVSTPLQLLPQCRARCENMLAATIMDNQPFVNILPFGMCSNLANPMVAGATVAAQGVLTPMPCIPATVAPWMPGDPTLLLGGIPALTADSKLRCIYGGMITMNTAMIDG